MTNQRAMKCMVRGEKYLKNVEKIILVLIVLCGMLLLSGKIYSTVGLEIEGIQEQISIVLSKVIKVIILLEVAIRVYNSGYSFKSEKVWQDIIEGSRSKVLLYLQNNRNEVPLPTILQLMPAYCTDNIIFAKLIEECIGLYKNGDQFTKSILSFVFLKNSNYDYVVQFLNSDSDKNLEVESQIISKETSDSIKNEFIKLQDAVTEERLVNFFQKLLHGCLPNNCIDRNDFIIYIDYILSWIRQNVTKDNIDSHQESMLTFILLLPSIKTRLHKNNKEDQGIINNIRKIETSEWFTYLIHKAYKYIDFSLCRNETFLVNNRYWVKYSYITNLYYERLIFWSKMKMLYKIRTTQLKLDKEYDPEKVVLFLLLASPISAVKCSSDDFVYNWLSLIYLCINPFMPSTSRVSN